MAPYAVASSHLGVAVPFVLVALAVAVVASYPRGGRLARVPEAPLRLMWLLFIGVGLQLAVDLAAARGFLPDAGASGWVLLFLSQLLVVVVIAANWHAPGMPLVAVGLVMNAVVMAANGAMPVSPDAIAALGIEGAQVPPGKHTLMTADTRLPWLADIFPLPILRTIISAGDVVLAAGVIPLVHWMMTYRPPSERRGRAGVDVATS